MTEKLGFICLGILIAFIISAAATLLYCIVVDKQENKVIKKSKELQRPNLIQFNSIQKIKKGRSSR